MKKLTATCMLAAITTLGAAPAIAETRAERAETRLEKMLEGRVAGEGESCISTLNPNRLEVINHIGLVYKRGDTIWVGRVRNPRSLSSSDIPIIRRFSSQLCSNDIITTIDRHSGFHTGSVYIEEFIPYTKVETENG